MAIAFKGIAIPIYWELLGVSFEDRQDLLGHKSGRITTHYSAAELTNLLKAAKKACADKDGPVLTLLRVNDGESHNRFHAPG